MAVPPHRPPIQHGVAVERLECRSYLALAIVLDYSLDSSGFFATRPAAQVALRSAADQLSARLDDTLAAIVPSGTNAWSLLFNHPSTGLPHTVVNPTVAADTVVVYVGARELGSQLGLGGPAGYSASGSAAFLDTVASRGEPGARGPADQRTDFAPAAGAVSFDSTSNWSFDLAGPRAGSNDFLSVALHELSHVLGFGTADSWENQVAGATFTGDESVASFGGPVPLAADRSHWAAGTLSRGREAAMTPALTIGTRKTLTDLDLAGLFDLGWEERALPAVTTVYISSSRWAPAFMSHLGAAGLGSSVYGFTVSAADALPLPWLNLDRLSVTFDRDVSVQQNDLVVRGTMTTYSFSGFAYNPATRTATWTLSQAIPRERLVLDLDTDSTAGGDVQLRVNVLPGDVDRSGTVLANDFSAVKQRFFATPSRPTYSVFHDVNGSGSILADDFSDVKRRFFHTLPA